tara:strand:+ start:401 stop:892 length:492 start_codon:yes stop_codon:yes gene_type:complete
MQQCQVKNILNRRKFVVDVCPSIALASFGITAFSACSKGEDETGVGYSSTDTTTGYTVNGNVISIDLDDPSFSNLQTRGWMNFTQQRMLLLKVSNTLYRAFTNSCPHQGSRNAWSYNTNLERFVCSSHSNSYPSDCTTPGTTDDVLECYETNLMGSTLSITKS